MDRNQRQDSVQGDQTSELVAHEIVEELINMVILLADNTLTSERFAEACSVAGINDLGVECVMRPERLLTATQLAHDARTDAISVSYEETGYKLHPGEERSLHDDGKHKHITFTLSSTSVVIDGSAEQIEKILSIFRDVLGDNMAGIVISVEPHQDGRLHVHGLAACSEKVRFNAVKKLRGKFDEWLGSTGNRIEFPKHHGKVTPRYQYWLGYATKEYQSGSVKLEMGVLAGKWKEYADIRINSPDDESYNIAMEAKIKLELGEKRSAAGKAGARRRAELRAKLIQRDLEGLRERQRANNARVLLKEVFDANNWKVEFTERSVIDMATMRKVRADDLWYKIAVAIQNAGGNDELFQLANAKEFIQRVINDGSSLEIPTVRVLSGWVELADCKFNYIERKLYALNDPTVMDIACIAKFDCTAAEAFQLPDNWITHLRHVVPDYAKQRQFLRAFADLFQPRQRHHKCINLYGDGNLGKDVLFSPFLRLFELKMLVINAANKFEAKPGYDIIYYKDVKWLDIKKCHESMSTYKAQREGAYWHSQIKCKDSVLCSPVHVLGTQQAEYADIEGSCDQDIAAILTRTLVQRVWRARHLLDISAIEAEDIARSIEAEAPNVMMMLARPDGSVDDLCTAIGVSTQPRPRLGEETNEDGEEMYKHLDAILNVQVNAKAAYRQ